MRCRRDLDQLTKEQLYVRCIVAMERKINREAYCTSRQSRSVICAWQSRPAFLYRRVQTAQNRSGCKRSLQINRQFRRVLSDQVPPSRRHRTVCIALCVWLLVEEVYDGSINDVLCHAVHCSLSVTLITSHITVHTTRWCAAIYTVVKKTRQLWRTITTTQFSRF